MMILTSALRVVVAAGGILNGSVAVAIGALVVVLAIVLVFVMVLRSNGGPRKTASGLGYDAQRGPLGQPGGDGTPWRQGQQPGWQQANELPAGAPGPRGGAAWGQTQDYPGAAGVGGPAAQGQSGRWGAAQGQGAGWDEPAAPAGGGWGASGGADTGPAGEQWPPRQPGGWGAAPQGQPPQGQPARPMDGASGGASGWDGPAPPPAAPAGGWDAPAQSPAAGGRWGAPAGSQQQMAWEQAEASAPAWGQPAAPSAAREWGQPVAGGAASAPGGPGGANGWGADAGPASGTAGAGGWSTPAAQAGPAAGFAGGFADGDRTRIASPAAGGRTTSMIVVRQGKEPGRMFEMRKDRMTIGRSRESDIFLEDLAVSRLHTTITREGQGQYVIRDENSANGTYVNGQKIAEHVLDEGDEIQVGQTTLAFVRR